MKILFIHNNYASNNSGEEHSAEALKAILEANGHEVRWFRRFSDVINNSLLKKGQAFFSGIYNPGAVRELKVLLDAFKPDIVQVQNLYPFISPGIVKTIKRRGIPLVMRCPNYRLFCPTGLHLDRKGSVCERCLSGTRELNCIVKNCEDNLPKSFGYALRNYLARTFWGVAKTMDAYIVQTAFQREKFITNGIPAHKLFVLPGLVPQIQLPDTSVVPKYVSFIGRVSQEKGIREFLEAARLLPKILFVVVGFVSSELLHLKENSTPNVHWKGFVAGKALDRLYAESLMVIVPSKWYEGFPNVITRAMKHAKPVITSNLGAMANIIDHNENGILTEPGDVLGLTQAIQELYRDPEKCQQLGTNARKKANSLYSVTKVYNDLSELYKALLAGKKRKTKRILSILHYPPPVHGAAMVGRYIMESEHINTAFETKYINLGTSVRVDEIGRGGWLKFKRYVKIISDTLKELYQKKPNLVYITLTASGAGFFKDAFIVLLAKAFGRKIVFHLHNKGVVKRQGKWLDNVLYKIVFKHTEVILLSKYLYGDIKKYVPRERVHFCPNGIPVNQNRLQIKERVSNRVQLLFLSNLIAAKGVFVLLDACKLLMDKGISFECKFIGNTGDIPLEFFLQKVKDLGLIDVVNYMGPKYGSEKEEAYSHGDIFVFPTLNECFPLVLLEAMQFSSPIISTYEGGIPEVVQDGKTGFLVEKRNPRALAEKLEILIEDPTLRYTMGVAGRKRYEAHFSLEAFEIRFQEIMEKLIV